MNVDWINVALKHATSKDVMKTIINLPVPHQEEISPGKQPLASEDDPAVWKYPVTHTLHQTEAGS